nr:hypothetical protein [uncultured Campylobacter sp.]
MKLVLLFSVLASLALGLDCNAKTYCSQLAAAKRRRGICESVAGLRRAAPSIPMATATACRAKNSCAAVMVINLADFLARAMKRAKFQI